MRFGLRFLDASWLGPVRFGSVPRPVPARSRIKRFGSVRFGPVRFGFLFLPVSLAGSPAVNPQARESANVAVPPKGGIPKGGSYLVGQV